MRELASSEWALVTGGAAAAAAAADDEPDNSLPGARQQQGRTTSGDGNNSANNSRSPGAYQDSNGRLWASQRDCENSARSEFIGGSVTLGGSFGYDAGGWGGAAIGGYLGGLVGLAGAGDYAQSQCPQ